ncbi:DUF2079 domain-containing protein [Streptacidiphilus neutrinimicus]|uniref:DUF2079 domain-containing protein n=1 Tax=Streptacidiphilus neutrinimicus TaxID=105420 RepID=UPI001378D5DC|nr:DUF2079 domain-containing protein [Streptacidiphilus neutrinimicus]
MSWDMGIFTEAVKGYAHLSAPIVDIKGAGYNVLGDHWSPIDALLAPAWWVWPSPLMLYAAQALLFGWSVWVVADTAGRVGTRGLGVAVGLAYGLSFGLQHAVDTGFHEVAFAVPLLAMVMRQLVLDHAERALWWALPLLAVKEDMGFTVAAVGVLVAVRWRLWLPGVVVAVVGAGSVFLDVLVLIPAFNPHHGYDYWEKVPGGSLGHLGIGAALLGLVWPVVKWQTLGWTFGVTGFVCLRSPLVLVAAPMLLLRFASTNPMFWDIGWHYSAPLMPVVFLAAVDALRRMEGARSHWQRVYRGQAIVVMVAAAIALTAALPLSLCDLVNPGTYDGGTHSAALRAADAIVPPGVTVTAVNPNLAMLAAKDRVFWAGDPKVDAACPDWIVIDTRWWQPDNDLVGWAERVHPGCSYVVRFNRDGVVDLARVG